MAGRPGLHRLHGLLGEPGRAPRRRDLGQLHVGGARWPRSTRSLEEPGRRACNVVAYCVGGTLAGTLLAILGKTKDKRVASATFFTAQLDFEDAGELQVFVDDETHDVVGEEMEKGFMPADRMAHAFNMLRANDLIWGYIVNNYMLGKIRSRSISCSGTRTRPRCRRGCTAFTSSSSTSKNAFANGRLSVRRRAGDALGHQVPVYHMAPRRTTSPRRPRSIAEPRR